MKKIILCADDYGLTDAVSQGIIKLAEQNLISAISCLTTNNNWQQHAVYLNTLKNIDIGLHLDLTTNSSLIALLAKAKLRLLNKQQIMQEFMRQLDIFSQKLSKLPDFIDGHQHIHQLPIICDAIFELYAKYLPNKPYMRHVTLGQITSPSLLKQIIITLCGNTNFKNKLIKRNIPHNQNFAGIYNFNNSHNYAALFPKFLASIDDKGLIMCHPGLANDRYYEFAYFMSQKFTEDCAKNNLIIMQGASILIPENTISNP